ncbi:MAG TPA: sigma-70 family RNA polymerase sigma factor [Candidatus Angelobacter sp.]|nr:sigma-70 family RNA polymerase sigma factor [Candidatus Angelobacter sp.]
MGKAERLPASGPITLIFEDRSLTINGELKDVSPSGLRIEHNCACLLPGSVARIRYADHEKKVRVIWVRPMGDRFHTGLLNHEAFLIARVRAGDETAFAELIGPYVHSLRFAIQAILRNSADADEAMQEALLKVALHLDQFRSGSDLKPWLYRIAMREALKRLRWNRRHGHDLAYTDEERDEAAQNAVEQLADPAGSPAEILERKEFAAVITDALDSLSEMYRQIFVACDLRQLPVKEAAGLLGINIDTANTRLHRARLLMRKRLREYRPEGVRPGRPSSRNLSQLAVLP